MHSISLFGAYALMTLPLAATAAAKPEFHPLWVPPGKSAHEIKPKPQARADEPVVLELRAHRHADGSLHFECDHQHPAASPTPSEGESGQ